MFCVSGQREIREEPWWAQQVHAAVHGEHGGGVWAVPAVWGEQAELPPGSASGSQTPSKPHREPKVSFKSQIWSPKPGGLKSFYEHNTFINILISGFLCILTSSIIC